MATDLRAAVAPGDPASAADEQTASDARQLATLPETSRSPSQRKIAKTLIGDLNAFFKTAGGLPSA